MAGRWEELLAVAQEEVRAIIAHLPTRLRASAKEIPVTYETVPNREWVKDGIAGDTLGLFFGPAYEEEGSSGVPLPPQIILFLENLWEFSGGDEPVYRQEVRKTYLHELGHYLGLDEDDLDLRDLQ